VEGGFELKGGWEGGSSLRRELRILKIKEEKKGEDGWEGKKLRRRVRK